MALLAMKTLRVLGKNVRAISSDAVAHARPMARRRWGAVRVAPPKTEVGEHPGASSPEIVQGCSRARVVDGAIVAVVTRGTIQQRLVTTHAVQASEGLLALVGRALHGAAVAKDAQVNADTRTCRAKCTNLVKNPMQRCGKMEVPKVYHTGQTESRNSS